MLGLSILLESIRIGCFQETKNHLNLIVEQNARVENYFSVLLIKLFDEFRFSNKIKNYKFQYLLFNSEDKRIHIDFFIEGKDFKAYIEIKHLAIDNEKKEKNKRSINFYTSKADKGRKVGIIGDIEKLNKTSNNDVTNLISFSIITNPPEYNLLDQQIALLEKNYILNGWKIESFISESPKLSFIICSKTLINS